MAVVAWMRTQPWYTGSFATLGASYMGFVQWTLLSEDPPPEDLKAAVIYTGPHDLYKFSWGTGAMSSNIIVWADMQTRQLRGDNLLLILLHMRLLKSRLYPTLHSAPLKDAVMEYFGGAPPYWLEDNATNKTDAFWKPVQHTRGLQQAQVPVMLTAGWYDLVLESVLDQSGGERLAVRVFVTGVRKWIDLTKWPPESSPQELFLRPGKELSWEQPHADDSASVFTFDPKDPTPAVSVPELFDNTNGQREPDTLLTARDDVLTFSAPPLEEDMEVCGKPVISLYHKSDHQYVDLLVVLSDVDQTGISWTISEKFIRLDNNSDHHAASGSESLDLSLLDCAHTFLKGHKIRVLIAGGSHPRYIRNLGTGEDPWNGSSMRPAVHTIFHQPGALSKLVVPVTTLGSTH